MTLATNDFVDSEKRYSVVKELGRGGMAIVYEVVDHNSIDQRHLALKIANSDPSIRERSKLLIESEYASAKRIESPRTVEVFDIGETIHGMPFFTMALTSGKTLTEIIELKRETGWFSLSEIYQLLIQIAEGVAAVHAAELVYADLKPSNVIVTDQVGTMNCILIDFGIACKGVPFSDDKSLSESTSSGMTGTSLYMSPEQIRGFPLTARSDIYSFGMVAYELCTASLPFSEEGIFSVTASHLMKRIPPVRDIRPELPKNLSLLIQVALEKQPRDRYSTIDEVLTRLRELEENSDNLDSPSLSRLFSTLLGRRRS